MIVKRAADHVVKQSPTCGEIREILHGAEYTPNVAIALDIGRTKAHFHTTFDEIYFVLDGSLELRLFDPQTGADTACRLERNELCVISRGIHHQVVEASPENRLCVITVPRFDPADEHPSDRLCQ